MKLIQGRTNDVVRLSGRRVVTPQAVADSMVEFGRMVQQFRIVQESTHHICVYLVKGRDFMEDTTFLIGQCLGELLGGDVKISIDVVSEIGREPSGKQRAIISNVSAS